jgi:hypothetical protein
MNACGIPRVGGPMKERRQQGPLNRAVNAFSRKARPERSELAQRERSRGGSLSEAPACQPKR